MKYINEQGEAEDGKTVEWESTWLQGSVNVSYATLVNIFGKPKNNDTEKTDAEWEVMTPAGRATIYNYKDGKNYLGDEGTATEDITDWHIGGTNEKVVDYINIALGNYHRNLMQAA